MNIRKENPNQTQIRPNPGLMRQSPAKEDQRKSLDFLRRIGPYQGVMPTPSNRSKFPGKRPDD
jgi:hypothetical protein